MNNKFFVATALLSVFLLPGCGSAEAEATQNLPQDEVLMVQRPEREPDMMGMVSNMVGNQMTILLFNEEDMPMRQARPDGTGDAQGDANQNQRQGSGFNPTQALGANGGTGGGRMMGGPGMGGGFRGQGQDGQAFDRTAMEEARKEMIKQLKERSIGSETITIPVGIPIIGGFRPGGEPGAGNQLSFSDIEKDSMITVWLNQEVQDKKVAEFVSLMGGGMRRMNNGGNSQAQN
ncbi:MAG: hypothetical protein ACOYUZ_03860 [Patescibacteria group bacterium]